MALAIDIADGCGLSNESVLLVTVEEEQGIAVFAVHFTVKLFNQLYITNNTERFGFKSGRAVHVTKLTNTDWLVVLQKEFRLDTTLYYFYH